MYNVTSILMLKHVRKKSIHSQYFPVLKSQGGQPYLSLANVLKNILNDKQPNFNFVVDILVS